MLGGKKSQSVAKIETLIGQNTTVTGDVEFEGGLHIDGVVRGSVLCAPDCIAVLTLSENGRIEGEVRVPNIILNGEVIGDVYAFERIELASQAKVSGNVYYRLIEMAIGAEVNGKLVHTKEFEQVVEKDNFEKVTLGLGVDDDEVRDDEISDDEAEDNSKYA